MSAWTEAVWIVKRLQKNFDFEEDIKIYTQNLNDLNKRVNTLNDKVAQDESELRDLSIELRTRATTFRAKNKGSKTNPIPDTSESYEKGTIWFVVNT